MKSIHQNTQLSDNELKAVLRGDDITYGQLVDQALDYSRVFSDVKDLAKSLYDKMSVSFQLMLEKVIQEEFLSFLENIAESGGNDSRNGYYSRKVRTFLGDFMIQIPRARYESFQTKLLEKYGHDVGKINSRIVDLYIGGMTEREVVDAIASISGIGISKEKVGSIVRETIGQAMQFNQENLEDCPIVFLDATYIPLKRSDSDGKKAVEKEGIMIALGVTKKGHRKVLGFSFGETESEARWKNFLKELKDRGMGNVSLFVTDGLRGLPNAIRGLYPSAKHQRCTVHFKRNLMSYVNDADKAKISADFSAVMNRSTREEAMVAYGEFKLFWSSKYRGMTRMLNAATENVFTYFDFPKEIHRAITTSNAIE